MLAAELRQSLPRGCGSIHAGHDFARGFAPVTRWKASRHSTAAVCGPTPFSRSKRAPAPSVGNVAAAGLCASAAPTLRTGAAGSATRAASRAAPSSATCRRVSSSRSTLTRTTGRLPATSVIGKAAQLPQPDTATRQCRAILYRQHIARCCAMHDRTRRALAAISEMTGDAFRYVRLARGCYSPPPLACRCRRFATKAAS
jgi:hypothetical protein